MTALRGMAPATLPSSRKSGHSPLGIVVIGLLLAGIAFGGLGGFPIHDDGYLRLFVDEIGVAHVREANLDRPLVGWILQGLLSLAGADKRTCVALAVLFWALLALETARLWRRLFPEHPEGEMMVALLVVAPIVVETQYTTLITLLPCNLPVTLALAGLLLLLEPGPRTASWRIAAAAGLALLGVTISEYGLATAAAGATLLAVMGKRREAFSLGGGAALGYFVLRQIADISARTIVTPSVQMSKLLLSPSKGPARLLSGIWYSLVGAYGRAFADFQIVTDSRSSWAAAAAALLVAGLTWAALSAPAPPASDRSRPTVLVGLAAAVGVGLLPVALANKSSTLLDYGSRYRLQILPFAVCFSVESLRRLTAPGWRRRIATIVAFIAAFQTVQKAFEARNTQSLFREMGRRLRPTVREASGIVGAVTPYGEVLDLPSFIMTSKATEDWRSEEAKRLWLMPPKEALELFGPRPRCRPPERIDTGFEVRHVGRHGTLSALLWLGTTAGRVGNPEPYCLGSPR